jgi:hypothetical protein
MSNLIFVLYVEQNKQDKVGRSSNELSGVITFLFGNGITEITHPEHKEGVLAVVVRAAVAKLLDSLL